MASLVEGSDFVKHAFVTSAQFALIEDKLATDYKDFLIIVDEGDGKYSLWKGDMRIGATVALNSGSTTYPASAKAVNDALSGKAASSHSHGNITNAGALQSSDITIASGDKIVVTDSSNSSKVARTSVSFDASTTTKALTPKGTWETFSKFDPSNKAKLEKYTGEGTVNTPVWIDSDGTPKSITIDATPTENSNYLVRSGGVYNALAGKQDSLVQQTAYTSQGSATKVPQITTNSLGQVTGITEVAITGVTPASHLHGNINNAGTITATGVALANNDALVIVDASDSSKIKKTSIVFDGSTTGKALTQKGTWESFVTAVSYDSTNAKITYTVNGTVTDVVSASTLKSAMSLNNVTNHAQVKRTEMGAANGVAQLDANGKVPASQLPSYVDDVIELLALAATAPAACAAGDQYYNTSSKKIFTATATNTWGTTGATPETGKIYVNLTDNKTYRWGGTDLAVISESLAIGETSSTAFAGDRGVAVENAVAVKMAQFSSAPGAADRLVVTVNGQKGQINFTSSLTATQVSNHINSTALHVPTPSAALAGKALVVNASGNGTEFANVAPVWHEFSE